jgi:type II secretory pathway pseudopilin PulG
MSMVEVIVSLSLITIVMGAAGLFFVNNLRTTGGQSQRQEAVFLANRQLETVQALSPSSLLTGRSAQCVSTLLATSGASTFTSQDWTSSGNYDGAASGTTCPNAAVQTSQTTTVNKVVYTIRTFINSCTLQSNGSCIPGASQPSGDTKMYRVTVDASWVPAANSGCGTGGCDYSASSLIDPHGDPRFQTNISQPTITSVSPSAVGSGAGGSGGVTLTITGSGFVAGATPSIDSGAGTFDNVTNNTGVTVTVPFHASIAGFYTLAITNPDGGRATISFTVNPAPDITSVNPTSVSGGVQTTVNLAGTGFQTGASIAATAGTVSNVTITPTTNASFKLTPPTSGGTVTITLTNPDGGTDSTSVTVVSAPNITSVSPSSVLRSSVHTLTLTGTDFIAGATLSTTAGTLSSFSVTNSTTATVSFTAPSTAQTVTLTFRNPDGGQDTIAVAVTAPPTITSTSPSAVGAGATVSMTLTGTGFQTGATLSANNGASFRPPRPRLTSPRRLVQGRSHSH